jgi:hypothetical protein
MPESTPAQQDYQQSLDTAQRLLGQPLVLPLSEGEPPVGEDFRRLATSRPSAPPGPAPAWTTAPARSSPSPSPPPWAPTNHSAANSG